MSILTCNNFVFELSIKNAPNPPKIYQDLNMMGGNTLGEIMDGF